VLLEEALGLVLHVEGDVGERGRVPTRVVRAEEL